MLNMIVTAMIITTRIIIIDNNIIIFITIIIVNIINILYSILSRFQSYVNASTISCPKGYLHLLTA